MRGLISIPPSDPNAMALVFAAKHLLAAGGDRGMAIDAATQKRALPRILEILKALPIGDTGDANFGTILADQKIASDAFIGSLHGTATLATMFTDGAITRVPLNQRLGHVITGSVGGIVDEGQIVPGSSFTLEGQTVPILKAQSFVVVSNEVARSESPAATALVNSELRKAVTATTDTKFMALAMVGAASIPSTGPADSDFTTDIEALLAAVNVAGARLYWAMAANVANRMALADKHGAMTPQGGAFLGLPALVSETVADGTLRLIDAASFGGDIEGIELATSKAATLDLGLPPDSPETSSTVPISLWQHNLTAIKATVYFGVKKLRSAAAAEVTGIANSPDSPA
jgi:hypothetical protein